MIGKGGVSGSYGGWVVPSVHLFQASLCSAGGSAVKLHFWKYKGVGGVKVGMRMGVG